MVYTKVKKPIQESGTDSSTESDNLGDVITDLEFSNDSDDSLINHTKGLFVGQ